MCSLSRKEADKRSASLALEDSRAHRLYPLAPLELGHSQHFWDSHGRGALWVELLEVCGTSRKFGNLKYQGGMSAERNWPWKTFKSIRKTVWKTRKRIRKTIRNAFEKNVAPLRLLKNISPALFNNFYKFFTAQHLHKKSFLFTARLCRGGHANKVELSVQRDIWWSFQVFLQQLEHNSGSQFRVCIDPPLSHHSMAWHNFDLACWCFGSSPPRWLVQAHRVD